MQLKLLLLLCTFRFQAENEFEAAAWMVAIETAIQIGLGDRYVSCSYQ